MQQPSRNTNTAMPSAFLTDNSFDTHPCGNKQRHVAVYVRLSKEDDRMGESTSIENQKLMLTNYIQEMGWHLQSIYQDDGFSGTNQNRPAFQRMLADVKQGFINTILIKDLSRLGRNYLEVGHLIEVFLPEHDCELISLHEKLDDMMVFRNWFNEQHSKSTSVKVRAARRVCAESGKFLGTYAPYGYLKDAINRHRLVPDEQTAPIVRRIFHLRAAGLGFRAIAMKLTDERIMPPRAYYYQNKHTALSHQRQPGHPAWSENTIRDIIKNEVYIGNTVQCKRGTVSYKNHRQKRKAKTQWIRVKATHTALIEHDLWERAQHFTHEKYKPRRRYDGKTNLFAGLLYCADCGLKLRGQLQRDRRKDGSEHHYVFYVCGTYAHKGKTACTAHGINEKTLVDIVAAPLRTQASALNDRITQITEAVLAARRTEELSRRDTYLKELNAHKKQIKKLDGLIDSLYEDRITGLIPVSLFTRQVQKYEQDRTAHWQEIKSAEERFGHYEKQRHESDEGHTSDTGDTGATSDTGDESNEGYTDSKQTGAGNDKSDTAARCGDYLSRFMEMNPPDAETLLLAIEKIIIGETRQTGGERVCDIRIHYRFTTRQLTTQQPGNPATDTTRQLTVE